ncbi:hypothetical protein FS837_005816 [Tulasnella sp. UAMH 9824]|nr:hypothetical protein FS837_005816 [Tulasnella sp. UAMH 9824]
MTPLPPNALPQAQSHLMDGVRTKAGDGTATVSPLTQTEAFAQAATGITSQSKPVALALGRVHNSRHPTINQLPTELLVGIFESCLDTGCHGRYRRDASQLHRICAVCYRWKTVAEASPVLWRYVSGLDPPQHIEKALRLSQPLTITVVYFESPDSLVSKEAFTAAVDPHVARWRRMSMVYEEWDEALEIWERSELPKLHTLEVHSHSSEYPGRSIRLSGGKSLPNLQVATFFRIPLRLDPAQLPGLRALELTAYDNLETTFTTRQLLHLLMGTPRLQSLTLFDVAIDEDVAFQGSITLPNLAYLLLDGVDVDGIRHLLSLIDLPKCKEDLPKIHHSGEIPYHPKKILYYGQNFDILEFQNDGIHFCVGKVDLSASTGSELDGLECMETVARRFAEELTSSQGIQAGIEVPDRLTSPMIDLIFDQLDRFPGVRALHMIQCSGLAPLLTLIGRLGQPKVHGGRVAWHLPHLEAILIKVQHPPFSELRKVLWKRRQAAATTEIKELRILPLDAFLGEECEIQVDYKTGRELDKLQDALGGGQLFWGSEPWKKYINGDGPAITGKPSCLFKVTLRYVAEASPSVLEPLEGHE